MIRAIIFDMDGLLLDSEVYWAQARTEFCRSVACAWREEDELSVKGCNSPEWAAVIRERCRLDLPREEIIGGVVERMRTRYHKRLPLLPGATTVVRRLSTHYPLAIASSSPPALIDVAMSEAGLRACFSVVVSADDVGRGKPAPDVFLAAARQLGHTPRDIAVFEDSTAGITAARAAGMRVIAVPNPHYPPAPTALRQANVVVSSLEEFTEDMLV